MAVMGSLTVANLEMTHHHHIDLECGGGSHLHHHIRRASSDADSQCFFDADEGSCYSQFYSTYDDNEEIGQEISENDGSRRVSSASDCSVDVVGDEGGGGDGARELVKSHSGKKVERDCRICHLSLADDDGVNGDGNDSGSGGGGGGGVAIELGCRCKDDLAAVHKHCAETWFKIKGNKICEICNSIVSNLVGPNETSSTQGTTDANRVQSMAAISHTSTTTTTQSRGCINGHRLLNFILACMVFAFVISWLFHFNIPS